MRLAMKVAAGTASLTLATVAQATTWVQVASSAPKKQPVLIDIETLKRLPQGVIVWVKFMKDDAKYDIERIQIDCQNDLDKSTALTSYASDGTSIENVAIPDAKNEPIVPDSVMQGVENYVCSLGKLPVLTVSSKAHH